MKQTDLIRHLEQHGCEVSGAEIISSAYSPDAGRMVALAYAREYRFEAAGSPRRRLQFGQFPKFTLTSSRIQLKTKDLAASFGQRAQN